MSIFMFFTLFFFLHMCLSTVSNEKLTTTWKIYWSYIKLAPSLNSLVTGPFICALLCSTHTNGPVTKHVLPVLLTFIKCDSRVLKLLQNAWQIHHRDHYLRHSTEVFQRYAVCGWKIMCCIKHILTNLRKQRAGCSHRHQPVFFVVWFPLLSLPKDFPTFCYSQKLYAESVGRWCWWFELCPPRHSFYPG